MNFNTSKCHLLTITHKPKPSEFTYTIANQSISRVNSHPHTQNNIDTLEKIHRSAARFIVHDHRRTTSVTHIQSKLGWQTLETRRLQHQLVFLYKIKYNLLIISLPKHLIVPCTRTRNSDPNKFFQISTRINTYAYSFYPRVIRAWNLLPNEIIRLPSIDTFHQAVSTFKLAPPAHLNRL